MPIKYLSNKTSLKYLPPLLIKAPIREVYFWTAYIWLYKGDCILQYWFLEPQLIAVYSKRPTTYENRTRKSLMVLNRKIYWANSHHPQSK